MKEFETRIVDIDVDALRDKLKALGAKNTKKEDQINNIYDFEDGRLLSNKGYARIRSIHNLLDDTHTHYMTVKKLVSQDVFKVMDEFETVIMDEVEGTKIFEGLGLVQVESIKKYRESYDLNGALVEIDINDKSFFPLPYIEVETESVEKLKEVVGLLGYSMDDTTSKTIYELIDEYVKKD